MKFAAIIPARYKSSRFPGKPLAKIKGISMIERVYNQTLKALAHVYVATDDERIEKEVKRFGGNCIMTKPTHKSGTDRLAEAIQLIEKYNKEEYDVIINVQGDEPFIHPEQIKELCACFNEESTEIATLAKYITNNNEIFNPNLPKLITNLNNEAIYFSRSPIPYIRDEEESRWAEKHSFKKHLGMYGYRTEILKTLTNLPPSSLEQAESLEQNRWLENGYTIKIRMTEYKNHPVDTPGDLKDLE
ncbi:MAG: 3-deoxy-manno-octulosonate cytidylyltransferase [Bacteroidota bacterium]